MAWNLICAIGYLSYTKIVRKVTFGWLDFFYGKVKPKMLEHIISWQVSKIFAQECSNVDLGLNFLGFYMGKVHGFCRRFCAKVNKYS